MCTHKHFLQLTVGLGLHSDKGQVVDKQQQSVLFQLTETKTKNEK